MAQESERPTAEQIRSRRKRVVRPSTVNIHRLPMHAIEAARSETPRAIYWRPSTRGDCADVLRPCPFVTCLWNLYLDVTESGNLKMNFPDIEPDAMGESCALDIADRGGLPLEVVGEYANLTRERVRQIEDRALLRLRADGPLRAHVADENRSPCRSVHREEPEE